MTYVPFIKVPYPENAIACGTYNVTTNTIDATGEKYAWIGRVRWADRSVTTRSIRKASFLFGTIVKAGGSGLTFSVQAPDLATGPTTQPDGTPIQSVAIANGDAGFASNTYYTTGNLSGDIPVDYGDLVCCVLEYDGSGRLGSDSVQISHANGSVIGDGPALLTASWATANAFNNIVLEFADGALGILDPAVPLGNNTVNFAINTGTNPDEVALKFTPDFKCKIDGAWIYGSAAAGGNFDVIVYEGTTALRTVFVDANTMKTASFHCFFVNFDELELTPSSDYYIAIKPATANNVSVRAYNCASTGVMGLTSGAGRTMWSQRQDAGSWTDTNTRRPLIGVLLSALDDGSGGGGGGGGLASRIIGGTVVQ